MGQSPLADPLFLAPGSYEIRAEAPAHAPAAQRIVARAGETASVDLKLMPSTHPEGKPAWPAVLLGIGAAAGVGLGIGLMITSFSKYDDATAAGEDCVDNAPSCIATTQSELDASNALLGGSVASFVIGGLAAAGLVTYLAIPGSRGSAQLSPVLTPTTTGMQLRLTF